MKRIKHFLIEKQVAQFWVIIVVLALTIVSYFNIDYSIRKIHDYYTPIIYTILILWIYYSIFHIVVLDETTDAKVIRKRIFDNPNDIYLNLILLSLLLIVGHRTFFIFGKIGVLISLTLVSFSGLFCILMIAKNTWIQTSRPNYIVDSIIQFIFRAGIIGYIYFIPWKNIYCHQFGVEEIGNYFEKDKYQAKYIVELYSNYDSTYDSMLFKLPANILISDDYSEYNVHEPTRWVDYSDESIETSETRYVMVNEVNLNNGSSLIFEKCLVPLNYSNNCTCYDQDGREWGIKMTDVKVNN